VNATAAAACATIADLAYHATRMLVRLHLTCADMLHMLLKHIQSCHANECTRQQRTKLVRMQLHVPRRMHT
jgi:hypothetical protein